MDIVVILKEKMAKIIESAQAIFKKDFIIGLDIGIGSIKIAQFIKKEEGLHLVKEDLREIKESQDATLYEQEIVSTLKELFSGIDLKKSKVIATVNCSQTDVKKMIAPYMPKAELKEGISLVAKNYFPFPVDESFLDFEILGDTLEDGVKKYEIVVAASPKITVYKELALLQKAGIKPAALVPDVYALKKAAEHTSVPQKESRVACFMDIGKFHTELIILKGQYPEFSRKIPLCGDDFTKAMTGALVSDRGRTELTLEEAEKIKQEIGIPSADETRIIDGKISTAQIKSMLMTPQERLIEEVARCFDYYREKSKGAKIESVVLSGGGASLKGLTKSLSDGLGTEVRLIDSSRFALAMGAALSRGEGINLLPFEVKEASKIILRRGAFEAAATAVIVIMVLIYIGMRIELNNLRKKISGASLELSSLQQELKKSELILRGGTGGSN